MNLTLNMKGLTDILHKLDKKEHVTLSLRTLNKVGDKIFTQSKKQAVGPQGRFNLKGGQKALGLIKKKANKTTLSFGIEARKKPLSLIDFKPRMIRAGVKVAVIKGKPVTYKRAFIAQPKGRKYVRKDPGARQSKTSTSNKEWVFLRKTSKAYPLKAARGVSPWKMVNREPAMRIYKALMIKEGPEIFQRELNYLFSKKGGV